MKKKKKKKKKMQEKKNIKTYMKKFLCSNRNYVLRDLMGINRSITIIPSEKKALYRIKKQP